MKLVGASLELVASVLGPGSFVGTLHGRIFFTVADDAQTGGINAHKNQELIGGARTTLSEGHVVLIGAPVIAVALDQHLQRGVLFQQFGLIRQGLTRRVREIALVKLKIDPFGADLVDCLPLLFGKLLGSQTARSGAGARTRTGGRGSGRG